jgi:hypothetical protein
MNVTGWMASCVAVTLCLAGFAGPSAALAAESEPGAWEVQIDVFSGRPNPVFKLQGPEIARVTGMLSQASNVVAAKAAEQEKAKAFPVKLGYRGLRIRQVGQDKTIQSQIRVHGKNMLVGSGKERSWQSAKDASLEQFLVDLALEKGAISKSMHEQIRNEMGKE